MAVKVASSFEDYCSRLPRCKAQRVKRKEMNCELSACRVNVSKWAKYAMHGERVGKAWWGNLRPLQEKETGSAFSLQSAAWRFDEKSSGSFTTAASTLLCFTNTAGKNVRVFRPETN